MAFGSTDILTTLILRIYEQGIPFCYLCIFPVISSMSSSFQSTELSLPKLNLCLSILLFWCFCIYNGFISLSENSSFVYRKVTDFCTLVSYLTILLNSLIRSNYFFFTKSLGTCKYKIMSSAKEMTLPVPLRFISLVFLVLA